MHREDLLVDDGRNRQAVEAVGERLPELDVVSPLACVNKYDSSSHPSVRPVAKIKRKNPPKSKGKRKKGGWRQRVTHIHRKIRRCG
jgi:hypothetical protein